LEQAFKLAEEAKGGLTDLFVTELCSTMAKYVLDYSCASIL
jgi:hypothetical protein